MDPLLQIEKVIEGAVEGERVRRVRDGGESPALEQPPVTVAPAEQLGEDHLPYQGGNIGEVGVEDEEDEDEAPAEQLQ